MKRLLLLATILLPVSATSQSADKGNWHIDVGAYGAIYWQTTNFDLSSGFGAAATGSSVTGQYFIQDQLSVVLTLDGRDYVTDAVDDSIAEITKATGGAISIGTNYYFTNNEKSCTYFGFQAGFCGLSLIASDGLIDDHGDSGLGGITYGLNLGWKRYFTDIFGIYAQASFRRYHYRVNHISANGQSVEFIGPRDIYVDALVHHTAPQVEIGFAFKF